MTTAIAKQNAIPVNRSDVLPGSRPRIVLAGLVITLVVVSIATSRMQPASASADDLSAAEPVSAGTQLGAPWLDRLEVIRLKRQLVRAGYSLRIDASLGPVAKSALADYLQLDETHPLSPFLARVLSRTVITGRRNPVAWNNYFGLDRPTGLVERPLTGPGGQLDANGNLRTPLALMSSRRAQAIAARNGKIAVVDPRTETLYLINPNGSGRRQLVPCPVAEYFCAIGGYAWSPNGTHLAFLRGHVGGAITRSNLSLYVINADGTHLRRLARCGDCNYWSQVAWSPDGGRIVFSGEDGLNLAGVSTGAQLRLTRSRLDVDPAWSPDGSTIVFGRGNTLYSIKPARSAAIELATVGGAVDHPAWAPTGTRIVFDGPDRIYAVDPDGSNLELLRGGSRGSGPGTPSWSPDASRIVFFNTPGSPGRFTAEVWVMKPDGNHARRLYHARCCVSSWYPPRWSPDGKSIAFAVDDGVLVMRTDGTHRRKVWNWPSEIAWQNLPLSRTR